MKIEHKLSSEIVAHVRQAREQIGQLETQYLQAMGQARELQVELAARRRELNTALLMVVTIGRLPEPTLPYMLNSDCTALLGEIADPPADIPPRGANGGSAGIPAKLLELEREVPADAGNAASRGQAEAQTRGYINGSGVEHGG